MFKVIEKCNFVCNNYTKPSMAFVAVTQIFNRKYFGTLFMPYGT